MRSRDVIAALLAAGWAQVAQRGQKSTDDNQRPRWCVLLTAKARGGLIALLAWEKSPGRAARGSVSPRKVACRSQARLHALSIGPRPPTRAKAATASSIFKIIYKDKQGDDLEEMTK